jgi:hypothetical protein
MPPIAARRCLAVDARVLDDLQICVSGTFAAEEHGGLGSTTTFYRYRCKTTTVVNYYKGTRNASPGWNDMQ